VLFRSGGVEVDPVECARREHVLHTGTEGLYRLSGASQRAGARLTGIRAPATSRTADPAIRWANRRAERAPQARRRSGSHENTSAAMMKTAIWTKKIRCTLHGVKSISGWRRRWPRDPLGSAASPAPRRAAAARRTAAPENPRPKPPPENPPPPQPDEPQDPPYGTNTVRRRPPPAEGGPLAWRILQDFRPAILFNESSLHRVLASAIRSGCVDRQTERSPNGIPRLQSGNGRILKVSATEHL